MCFSCAPLLIVILEEETGNADEEEEVNYSNELEYTYN